jgi:hypothetical protein
MTDPIEEQRRSFNNWLNRTGQSTLAVAKRAGINESALRHYKNGKTRDLRMENKLKIAQTQHAKLDEIFGEFSGGFVTPTPTPNTALSSALPTEHPAISNSVPLIGRIQNGKIIATAHALAWVEAPQYMALSNVYAVRVANTLNAPRLKLREIILCSPDEPVIAGDDAAVQDTDGEIQLMRCLESTPERGFTGTVYSDETHKITIGSEKIVNVARIVAIYSS